MIKELKQSIIPILESIGKCDQCNTYYYYEIIDSVKTGKIICNGETHYDCPYCNFKNIIKQTIMENNTLEVIKNAKSCD